MPAAEGRRLRPGAGWADVGVLTLLLGVAIATRAALFTTEGLYRDDAWPALATRTGLGRALRLGLTAPGFELFVRTWLGAGRSTPWAQLPSVLASVAAVVGVYLLARRVGCGPPAALVAGAVLALSPVSVVYATRVKQYSFEALWAVVIVATAVWAAGRPGRPPGRGRGAAVLGVAVAAGLFSAPLLAAGSVAVAVVAWSSWREGGTGRLDAAVGTLAFVAAVLLYARLVLGSVPPALHRLWADNYVDASGAASLVRTTRHVLDGLMAGLVYRHGPTGVLILAVLVAGAVAYHRRVAALAMGPVAVAVVLAAARRVPLGGGRIDEYLYPGLALAAAMTAQKVLELRVLRRVPPVAVTAVLAVGVLGFAVTKSRTHVRVNHYPGVDMAEMRTAVRSRMSPGDLVVVSPFSRYPWALVAPAAPDIGLSRRFVTGFSVASIAPDEVLMPSEYVEDGYDPAAALLAAEGRPRVWYVVTDTPRSDTAPAVQDHELDAERVLVANGWRVVEPGQVHVRGGHADLLVRG